MTAQATRKRNALYSSFMPRPNRSSDNSLAHYDSLLGKFKVTVEIRWDEKAGLRRDAVRPQGIDVLKAQIKGDRQ